MPAIIADGHTYSSQPLLYGLVRKGKTTYLQGERELDAELIRMGTEGAQLVVAGTSHRLEAHQLARLCDAIGRLGRLEAGLLRKGIRINSYLEKRRAGTPALPRYLIAVNESLPGKAGSHFFYTEEERDAFLHELTASKGSALVVADQDGLLEKKEAADLVVYTIYEEEPIAKIIHEI